MANDGIKIVLTLKQVNSVTFAPTGLVENNTPGTPEYIPPRTDIVDCPVSYSLACPLPIFQGYTGSIGYEFSVLNSVVQNPKVTSLTITVFTTGSSLISSAGYTIPYTPSPNYFSSSINSLPPGTFYTTIQYFSGSSALTTCTYSSSFIIVH